jgi:hypothetical protein
MTETNTADVVTADTGEAIPGALVLHDFHHGDGYEWIEAIAEDGWAALSNWGSEGWDLGQWPYVIVAGTRTADRTGHLFGAATYCEGDVTCRYFRTQRAQWEAITEQAFFSWSNGQAHGPARSPFPQSSPVQLARFCEIAGVVISVCLESDNVPFTVVDFSNKYFCISRSSKDILSAAVF